MSKQHEKAQKPVEGKAGKPSESIAIGSKASLDEYL
jgi:hypothetical protein